MPVSGLRKSGANFAAGGSKSQQPTLQSMSVGSSQSGSAGISTDSLVMSTLTNLGTWSCFGRKSGVLGRQNVRDIKEQNASLFPFG
jgi:hypothetical protein